MGIQQEIAEFNDRDYALLDSGEFEKLERFGGQVLVRPEPLAIWPKADANLWKKADIRYNPGGRDGKEGDWLETKRLPQDWRLSCGEMSFRLRLTAFKHVGIFPEQAANWEWIREVVKPKTKVLNLFGYTGGATLAAALAGAEVAHVDSSRPAVEWAKENATLSGLGSAPIRYLIDDAGKFVAREIRRGSRYDAILLDPPAFGRGPKGEIWKFETDLPILLSQIAEILNPKGGSLLLNTYSLGFPGLAVAQMVRSALPFVRSVDSVELCLKENGPRGYLLPTGIATRVKW